MSGGASYDTKGLDGLIKALKNDMKRARVGILGSKTTRNNVKVAVGRSIDVSKGKTLAGKIEANTNASVGAMHEFGMGHNPPRSFLRVPIADNLHKELDKAGLFDKKTLQDVIKSGDPTPWLLKIAVVAEGIVAEAFDSGGYGKWPAWKTPGYTNNTGQILVDTQQLRNSITSEVK